MEGHFKIKWPHKHPECSAVEQWKLSHNKWKRTSFPRCLCPG